MKIDTETLAVLDRCTTSPCVVVLPEGQLDRKLYEKVNKVLTAAGGKWSRSAKAHVFTDDATDVIEQALLTGEISSQKQELGVFYTPPALAITAAQALRLDFSGITVLEPSAGMGALALAAREAAQADDERCSWAKIDCFDILAKHVTELARLGFTAAQVDFLNVEPEDGFQRYDRIIMNPPFARQADASHFLHAVKFLKPGGRMVAIMSASVTFRETAAYRQVRKMVADAGGSIEMLPAGSFKESGTGVNTALVIYDKPS